MHDILLHKYNMKTIILENQRPLPNEYKCSINLFSKCLPYLLLMKSVNFAFIYLKMHCKILKYQFGLHFKILFKTFFILSIECQAYGAEHFNNSYTQFIIIIINYKNQTPVFSQICVQKP